MGFQKTEETFQIKFQVAAVLNVGLPLRIASDVKVRPVSTSLKSVMGVLGKGPEIWE